MASGYLKVEEIEYRGLTLEPWYSLSITNLETVSMFSNMFKSWFAAASANYNEFIKALKNKLDLPIWQAIKVKDIVDIERAKQSIADMILFDAYVKDSAGGTGKSFNWDLLKDFTGEFILAGGINKQNIIRAIRTTRPYIVDISSGIEEIIIKMKMKLRR